MTRRQRCGSLLLGWAGKAATEPPGFVPYLTNFFGEARDLVRGLQDEERDHATGRL